MNRIVVGLGPGSVYKVHAFDDLGAKFEEFWHTSGMLSPIGFGGSLTRTDAAIPALTDDAMSLLTRPSVARVPPARRRR